MSKNFTDKIQNVTNKMVQLENQKKQLLQQQKEAERKARTKRLIERGAIVESLIPNAADFTNEQIQSFLRQTLQTEASKEILFGLSQTTKTKTTDASKGTG